MDTGQGADLAAVVDVRGRAASIDVNYRAPTIAAVSEDTALPTAGGTITITGANFGPDPVVTLTRNGVDAVTSVEIKMFRIRSTWSNSNGLGERDRPDLEIWCRDDHRSKNEPKRPRFERDRRISRFVSPV